MRRRCVRLRKGLCRGIVGDDVGADASSMTSALMRTSRQDRPPPASSERVGDGVGDGVGESVGESVGASSVTAGRLICDVVGRLVGDAFGRSASSNKDHRQFVYPWTIRPQGYLDPCPI